MGHRFPPPHEFALLDCLARNLRELRADNGLTAEALAAAVGARVEQIDRIEQKRATIVRLDLLERLAEALGVASLDLLRDETCPQHSRNAAGTSQRTDVEAGPVRPKPGLY